MQGNSNKEGARHTPINLPPAASGGKETGFIGSRQTTENSVTRFPRGVGGEYSEPKGEQLPVAAA